MHLPDSSPRSSLYFPYRVYPARRASAADDGRVVIVGAGPIGLLTALDLARFGVRSTVLEQDRQVSHGSRAIVLTRRSLEILQQVGVVAPFLAKGLPWSHGRSYYRGREVYRMVMPHDPDDRFLPGLNLQQPYIEQYLVEYCERQPLIELAWGQQVVGVSQDQAGVTLRVDSESGEYDLRAPWVVAADGGRSPLRRLLGLRMEGRAYAGKFVIADIRADIDLPTERLCHFDPEWNPGNNVLVHRQPDGLWRIDYRLPDGETAEEALAPALLSTRIDAVLAMIGQPRTWELDWATVYTANTLTLPQYVHGRVAFVGDAAHLLPIFGVRGANTGLQDANNLAWKLACVMRGWSHPDLLASYSSERVTAALEICEEGGRSTRFMTPPTRGSRLLRDAVLSFSLSEDFPKDLLHWRTSRPHDYLHSPLNSDPGADGAFTAGPACGQPARNVRLADGSYWFDHLAGCAGFHLVVFAADSDAASAILARLCAGVASPLPLVRSAVTRSAAPAPVAGADIVIADTQGHMHEKYGATAGSTYLLRPDLHVCARWRDPTAVQLGAALRAASAAA